MFIKYIVILFFFVYFYFSFKFWRPFLVKCNWCLFYYRWYFFQFSIVAPPRASALGGRQLRQPLGTPLVICMSTVRELLAAAVQRDLSLHQKEIRKPPGFERGSEVCKLNKSLFGLRNVLPERDIQRKAGRRCVVAGWRALQDCLEGRRSSARRVNGMIEEVAPAIVEQHPCSFGSDLWSRGTQIAVLFWSIKVDCVLQPTLRRRSTWPEQDGPPCGAEWATSENMPFII